mgnify:CR=1 FL=1|jgi:hypothetical protein
MFPCYKYIIPHLLLNVNNQFEKLLRNRKYYAIIISYLRSTPKRQYNKKGSDNIG